MLIPTDTKVDLIVNKLTEEQFNQLSAEGRLNENQLWFVAPEEQQYMVLGRTDPGSSSIFRDWITPPPPPLTFTAREANSTVGMAAEWDAPQVSLLYSMDDGTTWNEFTVGSTTVTLSNIGDTVMFKAGPNGNDRFSNGWDTSYNRFTFTGKVDVSGNINSILNATEDIDTVPYRAFAMLFYDNASIVDASQLILPSTTVDAHGYSRMFHSSTAMTDGPQIMAQHSSSYEGYTYQLEYMFYQCGSLSSISLPDWQEEFNWDTFQGWTDGVASTGTFHYNGQHTSYGSSAIPDNWTVVS